jgi:disulfide oxidoreductase YuzD
VTTTRIDYILKTGGVKPVASGVSEVKLDELMRGTPAALKAWLELTPEEIPYLLVKDTEADLIVTAKQYIERIESGSDNYPEVVIEAQYLAPQWVW